MENFIWYLIFAFLTTQIQHIYKLLYKIPVINIAINQATVKTTIAISTYFNLFNTLFHELGHLVMSIATGGKAYKMQLFNNRSGLATTGNTNGFTRFLVSFAGYPVASCTAIIFTHFTLEGHIEYIAYTLIGVLLISLIFYVRNAFGLFWTALWTVILTYLVITDNSLLDNVIYFILAVIIIDSFISTLTILKLAYKTPEDAGDSSSLANQTHIPAIIWSIIFVAIGAYSSYYSLSLIF